MPISKKTAISESTAKFEASITKIGPVIDKGLHNFVEGQVREFSETELGINRLSSELCEKVKKWIRDTYATPEMGWTVTYDDGSIHDPGYTIRFS